jgi:hypothetical protein
MGLYLERLDIFSCCLSLKAQSKRVSTPLQSIDHDRRGNSDTRRIQGPQTGCGFVECRERRGQENGDLRINACLGLLNDAFPERRQEIWKWEGTVSYSTLDLSMCYFT